MSWRDVITSLLPCTLACTAAPELASRDEEDTSAVWAEPAPPDPIAPELVVPNCDATGPVISDQVSAVAIDREARLLAAATHLGMVQVFETRCWTPVASFAGTAPQFVGRELAFVELPTRTLLRWNPETDTVAPFFGESSSVVASFGYVAREHDELLVQSSLGAIAHHRDSSAINVRELGPWLCGFGFLTEASAYAVSESGKQTIWALDSGAVLDHSGPRAYGCSTVSASSDGRLAVADRRGGVLISETANQVAHRSFGLGRGHESVQSLVWDGPRIYVGGEQNQRTGALWVWEPGDDAAELVSLHPDTIASVAVSDAWVAVGLLTNAYGGRNPDSPRPPVFVPASYIEILRFPLTADLNPTPFKPTPRR